jgi:creatinine amidohydrolase
VRLVATLALPYCLFEHDALVSALVLAGVAAGVVDQARWPGRGRDRPLYAVGSDDEAAATVPGDDAATASGDRPAAERPSGETPTAAPGIAEPAARAARLGGDATEAPAAVRGEEDDGLGAACTVERRLDALAWPELAAALAAGPRVALVPLGATEQHGPHLPLATDTWIGDALAARLALRLPETLVCPTLPLGCSREHLDFPGTLDLRPATLAAVLADVLASLARHGFAGAFVFSAHGGNCADLAAALPALAAAAAPMQVHSCTDLATVAAALARVAAAHGVAPEAAGHHAGEAETSILMALRPELVRAGALAPGWVASVADPQTLFYPSLRERVPNGTVGDPRGASATRADAYLEAWVDRLEAVYRSSFRA